MYIKLIVIIIFSISMLLILYSMIWLKKSIEKDNNTNKYNTNRNKLIEFINYLSFEDYVKYCLYSNFDNYFSKPNINHIFDNISKKDEELLELNINLNIITKLLLEFPIKKIKDYLFLHTNRTIIYNETIKYLQDKEYTNNLILFYMLNGNTRYKNYPKEAIITVKCLYNLSWSIRYKCFVKRGIDNNLLRYIN